MFRNDLFGYNLNRVYLTCVRQKQYVNLFYLYLIVLQYGHLDNMPSG
jgi:hypothetical protein